MLDAWVEVSSANLAYNKARHYNPTALHYNNNNSNREHATTQTIITHGLGGLH